MFTRVELGIPDSTNGVDYYAADHLGTTREELSGSGWPIWKGEFTPFGQEISASTTAMHYKFTGQERDAQAGQDHFMFRNYVSSAARWTSPDPYLGSYDLTNPQSPNRYAYVTNNPLKWIDPLGLNLVMGMTGVASPPERVAHRVLVLDFRRVAVLTLAVRLRG